MSESGARYRPGATSDGAVRSRARCLIVMSAWMYICVDWMDSWPSHKAITVVLGLGEFQR